MSDPVNHPSHYNRSDGMECIDLVEMLPFCEGNAIKYLWRCDHKGARAQDLAKARWYIDRAQHDPTGGALVVEIEDAGQKLIDRACCGFSNPRLAAAICAVANRNFSFALACVKALEDEPAS